ncbi:MAG: OadG family protein [Clostridium sp.]|nr:OadG family protein [Clostridium sp.]
MKRIKTIILALACVLGLAACGGSDEELDMMTQLNYQFIGNQCAAWIMQEMPDEQKEIFRGYTGRQWEAQTDYFATQGIYVSGEVFMAGLESWWGAQSDMGASGSIDSASIEVVPTSDGATVNIPITGTKHDAVMEILIDENFDINGITTNVSFSFGEKMGKAGLNTLMGMGTVFVVLILISLIISAFSLIPKAQALFAGKSAKEAEEKKEAVDNAIAQIEEREELADDLELVAVISAAIAASEGAAGTDGFVVRSVRRVGR